MLIQRDVRLLTANGDDLTASDDPSRKMMRQIAGAFAEYEKARLVAKLKAARDRKRGEGKCEGRRSRRDRALLKGDAAEAQRLTEAAALARRLYRASPKTGKRMSLRRISSALAEAGHVNERGQPYHPQSIRYMLDR